MDDAGLSNSHASAKCPADAPAGSNPLQARRASTQSARPVDDREKTAYTGARVLFYLQMHAYGH